METIDIKPDQKKLEWEKILRANDDMTFYVNLYKDQKKLAESNKTHLKSL